MIIIGKTSGEPKQVAVLPDTAGKGRLYKVTGECGSEMLLTFGQLAQCAAALIPESLVEQRAVKEDMITHFRLM